MPTIDSNARPWRVLLIAFLWLLAAVAASVCTTSVVGFVAGFSQTVARAHGGIGWHPPPLIYGLASTIALQATLLIADVWQGRLLGGGNITLGLGAMPVRRHRLVAVFAVLMILWVCVYVAVLIHFHAIATTISTGLPTVLAAQMRGRPVVLAIRLLLVIAVAPLAEELFFRGWLWTALRRSWGAWPTALVTGGVWLAVHALNAPFRALILLPQAILLSLARHYGGSVRASLPIHVANNAAAVAIQIASVLLLPR
jgi:hypothetical protein